MVAVFVATAKPCANGLGERPGGSIRLSYIFADYQDGHSWAMMANSQCLTLTSETLKKYTKYKNRAESPKEKLLPFFLLKRYTKDERYVLGDRTK